MAGADAVKLEGGVRLRGADAARSRGAGIAFMGHIGMLPQSIRTEGGYRVPGQDGRRKPSAARRMRPLSSARAAFAVVLELVQSGSRGAISTRVAQSRRSASAPGAGCDGEVLVSHDLFGLFPWFKPRHVTWQARVAEEIRGAAERFVAETRRDG